jgi:DNA-binding NarL/FixJ family response regulator
MLVLIDDEDGFRKGLAENLREDGHVVCDYPNPTAMPPLAELGTVSLLIVDYLMPYENGLWFAERFHHAYPAVPILMVTVYPGRWLEDLAARRPFLSVCYKPLDYAALKWLLPPVT